MRQVIAISSFLIAATACTSSGSLQTLRATDWALVSAGAFSSIPGNVATPTITFGSDGRISVNTGCNSAGAPYRVDGDRLSIEDMMMTRRACVAAEGNRVEAAFVQALKNARTYAIASDELQLRSDDGTVLARFRAVAR